MLSAADIASMTATVAASFDVTVTVQRITTPTQDVYGHATGTPVTVSTTAKMNIISPSDSMLQLYAGVIGSQRALLIRFMPTTDIREGDQIVYGGYNWRVHEILSAESYTFVNNALIVTVA